MLFLFASSSALAQPAEPPRELTEGEAQQLLEMHSSIAWRTLSQGRFDLAEQMFRARNLQARSASE